jgi:hypothetical protein
MKNKVISQFPTGRCETCKHENEYHIEGEGCFYGTEVRGLKIPCKFGAGIECCNCYKFKPERRKVVGIEMVEESARSAVASREPDARKNSETAAPSKQKVNTVMGTKEIWVRP